MRCCSYELPGSSAFSCRLCGCCAWPNTERGTGQGTVGPAGFPWDACTSGQQGEGQVLLGSTLSLGCVRCRPSRAPKRAARLPRKHKYKGEQAIDGKTVGVSMTCVASLPCMEACICKWALPMAAILAVALKTRHIMHAAVTQL
jgi:hypothetical protein